ncbi:MAG: radical SAM protein [Nanoarchaeota archaeon]
MMQKQISVLKELKDALAFSEDMVTQIRMTDLTNPRSQYNAGKDRFRQYLFEHDKKACLPSTVEKLLRIGNTLKSVYSGAAFCPQTLEICPTYRCNMDCPTCIDRQAMLTIRNELSEEQILKGIRDGFRRGIPSYKFAGFGEPSLHSDTLTRVYKLVGKRKLPISLITNGAELSDELITAIVKHGTEYRVSFPSHLNDLYKKLMRPRNPSIDADKVFYNLRKIIKLRNETSESRLLIGASILIYPINYHTLYDFVQELVKAGVDYIMVKPCLTDTFAIGFQTSDTDPYKDLERIRDLATKDTAIFLTTERFSSAKHGRPYNQCKVAGIAPMILPGKHKGSSTLWCCGRGKGRPGYELKSFDDVPFTHDAKKCPAVCKEDAYNMTLEDKWLKSDIISREGLPPAFKLIDLFGTGADNARLAYLQKRLRSIIDESGVKTRQVHELLALGIIGHNLIYGHSITEIFNKNSVDDIIVFGIYLRANNSITQETHKLYKCLTHTRHRALSPQRVENIYSFF